MSNLKLIHNVTLITMNENKDIIENAAVVVEDDRIISIGSVELYEKYKVKKDVEIIDGEDGILMPGMINCHTHGSMIPFRSLADDYPDRLKRYLFPLEKKCMNKELVYIGARYAISEMLLGGVTTFCDMYYYEDEVAKACKSMGMRGILCETILNFPSPDSEKPYGGIDYAVGFIEKWKDDSLVTPGIAPHAPYTNSTEKLKLSYEISKKYKVPFTMHVAEMDYEVEAYKKDYGLTPVQYLESIGVLNDGFISAHTVLVDDKDIEILKAHNVGVSHNIGANSKGAKGVMPLMKMKSKGINIGLGSDGPMSGNTIDIMTQMGQVGKIHKLVNNDRSLLPAAELMEMATINGAKVLGISDKVGSIEIGKKADLVIIETSSVNMQPIYDYCSAVVYSANPSNVRHVIINGEIVVENRKIQLADFNEIRTALIAETDRIRNMAMTL
ncbi:MAG: amidohydrolase [Clostridium sp.]